MAAFIEEHEQWRDDCCECLRVDEQHLVTLERCVKHFRMVLVAFACSSDERP